MRKAERLFQLITLLRGRKQVLTADEIAKKLKVSVRTIYRDIQNLSLSGVPIEGEAGVGYRLNAKFDIPPVMFNEKEIMSLVLAIKMVKGHSDPLLSEGATSALDKIISIIPESLKESTEHFPYYVPDFSMFRDETKWHPVIRSACLNRNKINVSYIDKKEKVSSRIIWPLGLVYWGQSWTLLAWCELRSDFRNFRFDRFNKIEILHDIFPKDPKISFEYYTQRFDNCSP